MKLFFFEDCAGLQWYILLGEDGECVCTLPACEFEALGGVSRDTTPEVRR